jgi:RNA polymerase sigma factor (sigma-70 family)
MLSAPGPELPDRELLQRYLEKADEAAFAELVDRHGPMVLGVCQAVLHHRQDAEDAFQATFLVLARKASSIRRRDGLGSWLHGVAYRIARKARAKSARREVLEAKAIIPASPSSAADDLSWSEARALLHAELAALPECFREPLVLCYLQGLTQDEAAGRLGWTAVTLKGRLQRGRRLLRRRLERRGLGLAAALAATLLTDHAPAAPLSPALVAATLRAALPEAGETASSTVVALAGDYLGPLVPGKFHAFALGLLLAVTLTGGVALFSPKPSAGEQAAQPTPDADRHTARSDAYGDPLPEGAAARLGTVRFNHGDGLNALFFSPDGKSIISEGNGFIRLWDAATGKERRHFATAKPSFDDQTTLSPDGKALFLLNQDFDNNTLCVWDLEQGNQVRTLSLRIRRRTSSIYIRNALAPDGRLCAIHTPEGIRVFDAETGKELYQLPHEWDDDQFGKRVDDVWAVVFAGNDRLVMSDNKKQQITVWEARTGKRLRQFAHGGPVRELAASPDGRLLATLEHHTYAIDRLLDKDLIHLWDLTTGTRRHDLPARPKRWYMKARFSPDGKQLFAASYGNEGYELTSWDVATGQRLRELNHAVGHALAVSPDGRRLVEGAMPGKFRLWDLQAGRYLHEESEHACAAAVFLSPRGERAVAIGYSSVSAWDAATGRHLQSVNVPDYPAENPERTFSPDGRYALTFAGDWEHVHILVWDVAARRCVHSLRPADGKTDLAGAFSPDSSLLATWHAGKESVLRLWDLGTGKEVRSIKDPGKNWGVRLFFSADGKTLFLAGWRVVGIDVTSGKELFSWRMTPLPDDGSQKVVVGGQPLTDDDRIAWRAVAFSPDGRTSACILNGGDFTRQRVDNRIVLCEARTGKVIRRWSDSGKPARGFEHLTFSPDGRLLASGDEFTVHLWEVATGNEIARFAGHQGEIESLAFSGNGRRLASASSDSTVLIWNLAPAVGSGSPGRAQAGRDELNRWWAELAGKDARQAYAAIWRFVAVPDASTTFLAQHLRPTTNADLKRIRQLVDDLDSGEFTVRQEASRELKTRGASAEAALRAALQRGVSLEARRRIEKLLDDLRNQPLAGESVRTLRALTVLEQLGTPEARRQLRALADGAADAWLTSEARAACKRLDRLQAPGS